MKTVTFILTTTKEFRFHTRVYLESKDGKPEFRNISFTTEHKVSEKQRNTNARKIPAELKVNDERLYDGILRSPAYGKTFILKGDPEGKLKKDPFNITALDAKMIALRNMFESVELNFDSTKPFEVLKEEFSIYVNALTGKKIKGSDPAKIDITPVDIVKDMQEGVEAARALYKEKYGEDVPDAFANDKAFLSALSDPKFDAKAFMENADTDEDIPLNETVEDVRAEYLKVLGVNVANPKKNDVAWMKQKITEKKLIK